MSGPVTFQCPSCHSKISIDTDAPDSDIIFCRGGGGELGTKPEVREKAIKAVKKAVADRFRDIISKRR